MKAYELHMSSRNALHCTRRLKSSSTPSSSCWIVSPSARSSLCARNVVESLRRASDGRTVVVVVFSASSHATRVLFLNALAAMHLDHLLGPADTATRRDNAVTTRSSTATVTRRASSSERPQLSPA